MDGYRSLKEMLMKATVNIDILHRFLVSREKPRQIREEGHKCHISLQQPHVCPAEFSQMVAACLSYRPFEWTNVLVPSSNKAGRQYHPKLLLHIFTVPYVWKGGIFKIESEDESMMLYHYPFLWTNPLHISFLNGCYDAHIISYRFLSRIALYAQGQLGGESNIYQTLQSRSGKCWRLTPI